MQDVSTKIELENGVWLVKYVNHAGQALTFTCATEAMARQLGASLGKPPPPRRGGNHSPA
jgi:hypothetical protein